MIALHTAGGRTCGLHEGVNISAFKLKYYIVMGTDLGVATFPGKTDLPDIFDTGFPGRR